MPIRLVLKRAKCEKIRVSLSAQNVWKQNNILEDDIIFSSIQWVFYGLPDEHYYYFFYYFLKSHKIKVGRARLISNRLGVALPKWYIIVETKQQNLKMRKVFHDAYWFLRIPPHCEDLLFSVYFHDIFSQNGNEFSTPVMISHSLF